MTELAIYTSDKVLYPVVQEALTNVVADFPNVTSLVEWRVDLPLDSYVLVLGKVAEGLTINQKHITTLSQGQIMTNPAANTELKAALSNLFMPKSFPPLTYSVVDGLTDEEFDAIGPIVVIDIETTSQGKSYDDVLPSETPLLSLAINDGKNIYVFTEESLSPTTADNARGQIINLLRSDRKFIAHNMKFDFRTMSDQLGGVFFGHFCTMLAHHALNPGAKEHGLKPTCMKYLGAPDWESEAKAYLKNKKDDYAKIPRPLLYHYNAYDVYWTWYLFEYLVERMDDRTRALALHEFRMSHLFQKVEAYGAAVDLDYLAEIHQMFMDEYEPILAQLRDITGSEKYNPNSWKQVMEALASAGITVKSTDEDTLTDLLPQVSGTVQKYIELQLAARKITKMDGTYVKGWQKRARGNIVFPTFKVHGTNTGRLSSADPNIQNLPRDEEGKKSIRRMVIARDPSRILVNVDYGQAELRVMAELSDDEYLISLFQPGMPDFFDSLMPIAYPRDNRDAWDKATAKNKRANLKSVIYGLSYGRQAFAIAKELEMPVREAKSIIQNYFQAAPQFYDWRQIVTDTVLDPTRNLMTPFGRYFQSELITNRNRQSVINSGLAFLPQSTASDLCVMAAMDVQSQFDGTDCYIVATVHDAILMDVPKEKAQWAADITQEAMRKSAADVFHRVPFATDPSQGPSWEGI